MVNANGLSYMLRIKMAADSHAEKNHFSGMIMNTRGHEKHFANKEELMQILAEFHASAASNTTIQTN